MHFLRNMPRERVVGLLLEIFPQGDRLTLETCLTLFRLANDVTAAHEIHMASHGLSKGRFAILMFLRTKAIDGASPSRIAESLGTSRATVTGLLDGLEREKLITRAAHADDRRKILVTITQKGQKHLQETLPDHLKRMTTIMGKLNKTEMRTLVTLLEKVHAGIPQREEQ